MEDLNNFLYAAVLIVTLAAVITYLAYFVYRNRAIRRYARYILVGSAVLQTCYIAARFVLIGYPPITTQHEAVVFFAWATTYAYLSFRWRYTVNNFGTFVSLVIMLLLVVSAFFSRESPVLVPVLQSGWLPVHAGLSVVAYGFFSLAFCGGCMYLLMERELKKKRLGYFFERLPSLGALDQLNSHCVTTGFIFLTLGIVTGSFWAAQAWGAYWQWDPKETWSLITWMLYLVQIHQRFSAGMQGKKASIMAVASFAAVLFTLWGVTYLLGGAHSYVG
ncbi:MAG: c-type cytochrome biogenesis protein CcsB [Deltaproteobacteria bacterium]|nr:MAG: c-type cytochrome biogenesis protein CcsB [Desulfobacterales bacterium]PIE73759.1 MAG: c-type cytochrome biogenesis protein CcsB [Deltaproteobacteria bacterium]